MLFKALIRKLKKELKWFVYFIKLFFRRRQKEGKIILVGDPLYGNIGDAAIAYAEYAFVRENLNKEIFSIPQEFIGYHTKAFRLIIGKEDTVLFHGGGFLGTLWPIAARDLYRFLSAFSNNRVIVMPQTVFFSNDDIGKRTLSNVKSIFKKSPNLVVCVREKYSYDFMIKNFNSVNTILVPDMVTYLQKQHFYGLKFDVARDGILCCLRSDKEKEIEDNFFNIIIEKIKKRFYIDRTDYTDTVLPGKRILPSDRERIIAEKITQFSGYKFIITDRLHGMVLAALAETPCIAVACNNYKIKGVYDWIKNNKYVAFIESVDQIDDAINIIHNSKTGYDNYLTHQGFQMLCDLIKSKTNVKE